MTSNWKSIWRQIKQQKKEPIAKKNPQMDHNQERINIAVRLSHRRRFEFSRWCSKASRTTSNNQERNQERNQQRNQQRNHPRTEEYLVYRKYTSSKAVIGCLLLFILYTYPQTLLLQKHFADCSCESATIQWASEEPIEGTKPDSTRSTTHQAWFRG